MRDFKTLVVWQKPHRLTLDGDRASSKFPADERFGLTAQLRRAILSVPTNIAGGCGRNSDPDFARFLEIAMGSASESGDLFLVAHDRKYLSQPAYESVSGQVDEVQRMLAAFIRRLRTDA